MQALLVFLNGLDKKARLRFCKQCGTTENYLRKAISTNQKLGGRLCIAIEKEARGLVRCEELRPDIDWAFLRGSRLEDFQDMEAGV